MEAPLFAGAPMRDDFEIYDFYKKMNEIQLALY